jgi:hypothetical protein
VNEAERRQAEMEEFVAMARAEQARQARRRQRQQQEEMTRARGAVSPLGGQAVETR